MPPNITAARKTTSAKTASASKTATKVATKATAKAAPKVTAKATISKASPKTAAKTPTATTKTVKPAAPKAAEAKQPKKAAPAQNPGMGMDRQQMIATAAYYRAAQRGFDGGDPMADWLAAEAEVDGMLSSVMESTVH